MAALLQKALDQVFTFLQRLCVMIPESCGIATPSWMQKSFHISFTPPHRNGVEPGDVGIIVHIKTINWTPAIFADSNDEQRVSEASLRVAVNLGLSKIDPATLQVTGLTAGNGDDARDFFYLYFPGSAFSPQQSAPDWPESAIRQAAAAKFAVWGGLDMVRQCLNQI